MSRASFLALSGLAAVLVASLVVEYQSPLSEGDPLAPTSIHHSVPGQPRVSSGEGNDIPAEVSDILARPLFSIGRRPPAGIAATPAGPGALPRLTAVLVSGRGKTVIFAGSPKPVALGEGGRIGAYVVQSIGVGQATLVGPGGAHVLRPMFEGNGTAATSAPAPAEPSMLDLLRQNTPLLRMPATARPLGQPAPAEAAR